MLKNQDSFKCGKSNSVWRKQILFFHELNFSNRVIGEKFCPPSQEALWYRTKTGEISWNIKQSMQKIKLMRDNFITWFLLWMPRLYWSKNFEQLSQFYLSVSFSPDLGKQREVQPQHLQNETINLSFHMNRDRVTSTLHQETKRRGKKEKRKHVQTH